MATATNRELIECWRNEPAPLLPLLHAFHDRDGFISEDALRDIAVGTQDSACRSLWNRHVLPSLLSYGTGTKCAPRLYGPCLLLGRWE